MATLTTDDFQSGTFSRSAHALPGVFIPSAAPFVHAFVAGHVIGTFGAEFKIQDHAGPRLTNFRS